MKNEDSMKRIKAAAEAVEKLMKEQDALKGQKVVEDDEDDIVLAADMLMEASGLLDEAGDLLYQAAALLRGEEIEADCCFPCCVVEVCYDDEL